MRRSEITLEWENNGRVSEAQESLLRVLEVRFPGQVIVDIKQVVEQQTNLAILNSWFDRSLTVVSLEEFRQVLGPV